jgi:molecular chaperone DnaK
MVVIDGDYPLTEYTPEMISALILTKIVDSSEASLGEEVEQAVITVPADFPPSAREATKHAAEIAGIDVLRLLPEPSAACVAYALRPRETDIERGAVYDLGGGTFDISIVNVVHDENYFDVEATDGRQQLGGEDFDQAIAEWAIEEFEAETGIDVAGDPGKEWQVRRAAKNAKHHLSAKDSTNIRTNIDGEPLDTEITREKLEELTGHLVDDTIDISRELLEDQGLSTDDIAGQVTAYVGEGHFTDDPVQTFGGYGVVHVPEFQELLRYICENGYEHHVAVNLTQVGPAIHEAFNKYLGWPTHYHARQ